MIYRIYREVGLTSIILVWAGSDKARALEMFKAYGSGHTLVEVLDIK